jgi:hypothetical protein
MMKLYLEPEVRPPEAGRREADFPLFERDAGSS